ncbi:uncharacterized protein LOC126846545 isoform X2 [Adelges cooleyi]|uniref:uncharacterized protein LOC126846545 isoform X2 n=1 Tax=Adelges cooleyi TaxID=133065 RepID=UPI0021807970|nr:uncharacterized protein LOC126846545 isoform X2 [Adelges cooleyi]
MHFKFIISLVNYFFIANHVLGAPPDLVPESTENEHLSGVYAYLTNLLETQPDQPISNVTLDRFFAFVDPSDSHVHLVDKYFTIYPMDWLNYQLTDNIDELLFRRLVRFICVGTGRNIIKYTSLLVGKIEGKQEKQGLEIIQGAFGMVEKRTRMRQESLAIQKAFELARKYFNLPSENNIHPALFDDIVRTVCAQNNTNVLDFMTAINNSMRYILNDY